MHPGIDADTIEALRRRYHLPEPRTLLGPRLVGLANAAIDVSDGLAADLGHICAASGLGATVDIGAVPLSAPAQAALDAQPSVLDLILGGGDDLKMSSSLPWPPRTRMRSSGPGRSAVSLSAE